MKHSIISPRSIVPFVLCLALCVPVVVYAQASLPDLLAKYPAQTVADFNALNEELLARGSGAIKELCAMLAPMGKGDDIAARFALSGLAKYVTTADVEAKRKVVADALIEALPKVTEKEVAAFIIRQLQLAGKEEAVAPLSGYLADEELCDPAACALRAIATPAAVDALLKALPAATGANRVTIIKNLGDLRVAVAVELITQDAVSEDLNTRQIARFALANIGALASDEVLRKAAKTAPSRLEKAQATQDYLLYARRLAEAGEKDRAEAICRSFIQTQTDSESNVACAALSNLVAVIGEDALGDLIAAMDSPCCKLRATALERAADVPGKKATQAWVDKMERVPSEPRAEILGMLGQRGDASAVPAVLAALKAEDEPVRLTAIDAAARFDGRKVLPALLEQLETVDNDEEIKAIQSALLRLSGKRVVSACADALPRMKPPARIALLEVLSARRAEGEAEPVFAQTRDADSGVRVAATRALERLTTARHVPRLVAILTGAKEDAEIKAAQDVVVSVAGQIEDAEKRADAILAALDKAKNNMKPRLVAALPGVAGARALDAVVAETKSGNDRVKEASMRALAEWPNPAAMTELLAIAKGPEDLTLRVLALRGYIRLAGSAKEQTAADAALGAEERIRMYKDAMDAAERPDEKKLALAGLADIRTLESLELVAESLDDEALKAEAALAAVKIACPKNENDTGLLAAEAAPILEKCKPLIQNEEMRKKIEAQIAALPTPDDEGFVTLFNGVDLTGWAGDTKGYVVENGVIVCKPGGQLFTEKDYANFIFRFEFKLTPGANNGLGIRTPFNGHAAYEGMEIQILDNTADKYKDLQPYQYHGSIYGVVPAKRGHQKPVGEWNEEEVIAQGPHITVNLNGVTIVDADINEASANGTPDHREHPGLKNKTGRIGFLGHGDVLEFRNIRIKELE